MAPKPTLPDVTVATFFFFLTSVSVVYTILVILLLSYLCFYIKNRLFVGSAELSLCSFVQSENLYVLMGAWKTIKGITDNIRLRATPRSFVTV